MKKLLILISLLTVGAQASASLEIRAHYGIMNGVPSSFNKHVEENVTNAPDIKAQTPIGADLVYSLPVVSFAFGVRYEMINSKQSGDVTVGGLPMKMDSELNATRISLLGGYRLIETPVGFLGLMAHVGVSSTADYKIKLVTSGVTVTDEKYKGSVATNYGAGLEAAATLGMFLIGGELGYTTFKGTGFKASDGSYLTNLAGEKTVLDLSGTYVKVLIGLSI